MLSGSASRAAGALSHIAWKRGGFALEGPGQGVWFWCLIGLGTRSVMVYRAQALGVLPHAQS
jgi:hypothetical protein